MLKVILIGPITQDTIVKGKSIYSSTGGAVYYHAGVLSSLGIDTTALVTIAKEDQDLLAAFPENVNVVPIFVKETLHFENIYPQDNPHYRIQRAYIPDNPIKPKYISKVNLKGLDAILLGPLCPADIPLETLKFISKSGVPIYLGAQGYLRHLKDHQIILKPWKDFKTFLKYAKMLFLDENEARVMVGQKFGDLCEIAKSITSSGPEETIITQGNLGAFVYSKKYGKCVRISACTPKIIKDPTGLGDTFMAAYAASRFKKHSPKDSGIFAAATAAIKIENKGAFSGSKKSVMMRVSKYFTNKKMDK
ncbi:MAG: carbohydrate kinase [Euryarchaeota archaeon]|nr:carbohydrate kinase [Euryarchaeota archaeon]